MVQTVRSTSPDVNVVVVDWDDIESAPGNIEAIREVLDTSAEGIDTAKSPYEIR